MGAPSHSVPKSGCKLVLRPMLSMKLSLFGCNGYSEISVFHGLSEGNIGQPARVGPPVEEPPVVLAELPELPPFPFVAVAELEDDSVLLDAVLVLLALVLLALVLPLVLPVTSDAVVVSLTP